MTRKKVLRNIRWLTTEEINEISQCLKENGATPLTEDERILLFDKVLARERYIDWVVEQITHAQ